MGHAPVDFGEVGLCRAAHDWQAHGSRQQERSDAELREIELEENLRRKDLTALERSRKLVELAETAAEIAEENPRTRSAGSRGPAPVPGSTRDAADRIGVDEKSIRNAREHVAAVDRYPELARVGGTQKDAVTIARNLDKLADDERVGDGARIRCLSAEQKTDSCHERAPQQGTRPLPAVPARHR